jgi:hypothetical protein
MRPGSDAGDVSRRPVVRRHSLLSLDPNNGLGLPWRNDHAAAGAAAQRATEHLWEAERSQKATTELSSRPSLRFMVME